jgi:Family of unknown function (DUF5681)
LEKPDVGLQITGKTGGARDGRGRFRKGVSGNPNGRPPGSVNEATRAAALFLDGEAEALTRKAVELALAATRRRGRRGLRRGCGRRGASASGGSGWSCSTRSISRSRSGGGSGRGRAGADQHPLVNLADLRLCHGALHACLKAVASMTAVGA